MLLGDLYTYETKSEQSGGSPNCQLCEDNLSENISHIITFCSAYSEIRLRILNEYSYLCLNSVSRVNFENILNDNKTLCQFILDPFSINLKNRNHPTDPLSGGGLKGVIFKMEKTQ